MAEKRPEWKDSKYADAKGRFKKTPITTKIGMRMNSLRLSTLKAFGLDTTGKLGAAAKIDPELTKKSLFSFIR